MTRPNLRLTGAVFLALALAACGGGEMTAEDATTQACDALAEAADSVTTLAEGAAAGVDSIREAGTELRDRVAEINEDVQAALGSAEAEAVTTFIASQRAYRSTTSGAEDQAGLDAVEAELAAAGADLQARYDEAVTALGCG
jgi:hypothetical protein